MPMTTLSQPVSAAGPLANAWARVWRSRRLVERNIMVYRHQWIIILSGVFEPIFYLLGIGLGSAASSPRCSCPTGEVMAYAAYVAPALVATAAMNGAVFETIFNVFFKLNYAKTYDGVLATPMGITEIAIGEMLWALTRAALYAIAMFVIMVIMSLVLSPLGILMVPAALLVAAAFAAAGLAGTSYLRTVNDFDVPMGLIVMPMFLFSGTFFPIEAVLPGLVGDHRPAHAALPRHQPDPRAVDRDHRHRAAVGPALPGRLLRRLHVDRDAPDGDEAHQVRDVSSDDAAPGLVDGGVGAAVGLGEDGDRVDGRDAGRLLDLPAAGLRVAGGPRGAAGARRAHLVEERRPDVLGDLPALDLQPVGAGGAAAVVVRIDGVEAGNEPEQVHRRRADAVRLELARRVVRQLLDDRREAGIELAAVVQVEQELADVPGRIGDRGGVGSARSSISRYSALSAWVQEVEVPTIR